MEFKNTDKKPLLMLPRSILFMATCLLLPYAAWSQSGKKNLGRYEIEMTWTKQPSMPEMKGLYDRTVGVGAFSGPNGLATPNSRVLTDHVAQALTESGKFKVLDRNRMEEVFREQQLSMSGLMDEATIVEAGKLAGAHGVAVGRIQMDDYSEQWVQRKAGVQNGQYVYTNVLEKRYQVTFMIEFIEVGTGAIVAQKTFSLQANNGAQPFLIQSKDPAAAIPCGATATRDVMERACMDRALVLIRQAVAPYSVNGTVKLEGRGKLKDPIQEVVTLFQTKDNDLALERLKALAVRDDLTTEEQAAMCCNMGYLSNAGGEYCEARDHFKRAFQLSPREDDYRNLFNEMDALCGDPTVK